MDENKYRYKDDLPYTLTVENPSSKLHDSSKPLPCSLGILSRKQKIREKFKPNL